MLPSSSVKKDKILIVSWLIEHFPAAFFKKPSDVKPLQIGIFEDILDFYERLDPPPFSKKALKDALRFYSASKAYLLSQKEGVGRVDLYGNEVDVVTKEQAKYAASQYQQRYLTKSSDTA